MGTLHLHLEFIPKWRITKRCYDKETQHGQLNQNSLTPRVTPRMRRLPKSLTYSERWETLKRPRLHGLSEYPLNLTKGTLLDLRLTGINGEPTL